MYRAIENQNNDHLPNFRVLHFGKKIVTSYLNNNPVPPQQLEKLIWEICTTLKQLPKEKETTSISNSVTNAFIICLEDGKKFQSLGTHLTKIHKMTPEEYRSKWNLPSDYPMACQRYKKKRAEIFLKIQQKYPNRKVGRPRKDQIESTQPKEDNMRRSPRHRST